MLWTAIIVAGLCVVVGVPFTYYWFRVTDRWAKDDQKRFGSPDRSADDREEIHLVRSTKDE